jgi:hypothetical protein
MQESGDGRVERVIRQTRTLRQDAQELSRELKEGFDEVRTRIGVAEAIQQHPWRAVFVATGAGYVLGGGFFTPLTRRLVGIGLRSMLLPVLTRQAEAMVRASHERSFSSR